MSYRFRLPILSEQVLSEIIFGMENQKADYLLDISTGTLYNQELDEGSDHSAENLVSLPPWNSTDGYQLMVAFTNSCKDKDLQRRLSDELNSRQKGVFRRFRDILAEDNEVLNQWYEFKDRRMKSYIRSYYRTQLSNDLDSLEDGDDVVEGELLSEFEVCHLEVMDVYCEKLLESLCEGNPIKRKIFGAFNAKEAFVVRKNGSSCGAIIYEIVENQACILHYQVDEEYREMGLFSLMFDLFNREMERKHICRICIPFSPESAFIKQSLAGHEVALILSEDAYIYKVEDWTGSVSSSEYAYVL